MTSSGTPKACTLWTEPQPWENIWCFFRRELGVDEMLYRESGKGRQSCGQRHSGLQGAPPQTALPESQPDYSLCSEGQKRTPDVLTRLQCPIQLIAQTKSRTQRAEKIRGQWDQDTPTVIKIHQSQIEPVTREPGH